MSPQKRFGEALRPAWEKSGLTQQELTDLLSEVMGGVVVTQRHVNNWIRGQNLPRDRVTYLALCRVLNDHKALCGLTEVNALLDTGGQGAFHNHELAQWLPELLDRGDRRAGMSERALRPEPLPWYARMIEALRQFIGRLDAPERYGMLGAIALVTILIGSTWRSPALWGGHYVEILLFGASLLVSTFVLIVPPSRGEPLGRNSLWWQRKLYRLSGTIWGIVLAVSALFWLDGLWQLVGGSAIPRPLIFLLTSVGAAFAYGSGENVQWVLVRGPATAEYYNESARFFSVVGLFAQAIILILFYYVLQPMWSVSLSLLFLAPAVILIIRSIRR